LLASLLEELAPRLTPRDNGLLVEAACDGSDAYLPSVRGWAMAHAGRRRLTDARLCLEAAAVSATDARFVGEALDALGDLGDRRSVPVLVAWINEAMRGPQRGTSRASRGALSGAVLALGKIGDATATPTLFELVQRSNDATVDSTVVHALGLIGSPGVDQALDTIGREHPNPQIRDQARTTLQQLQSSPARRNP
jgi:HEAT repeat protein